MNARTVIAAASTCLFAACIAQEPGAPPPPPSQSGSPPGVSPPPTVDGGHAGAPPSEKPTEEPPPPPAPSVDRFGVRMLYPSALGGESWELSDDPASDERFIPQNTISRNADGSWKMKSDKVRMVVATSTGYDRSKISTYDRDELLKKKYMQAPNDWKNVEMTGYVKVNDADDMSDNFAWYARGGRHTSSVPCEGSAYKGDLHYDGRARIAKESWHVSYDYAGYKPATTSLRGRWVGLKVVIRDTVKNDEPAVRIEVWLDDAADKTNWKKVYDFVDDGSWAGDSARCGASSEKVPLLWGGPTATFRWDSATDADFEWLGVREILPETP